MVQLFCKLCLKSVPAITWKTHITQKEHLHELPCKLAIKGSFNKDKSDALYEYFAKFGGIRGQNFTFENNDTIIEYRFWDARVYSEIIHQEHRLFDQEIEISWYKNVKSGKLQHVVQDEKMRNEKFVYRQLDLINSTKGLPSFPKQMNNFMAKIKTIKTEMDENKNVLHDDLMSVLTTNFTHNKLHFFGSSITDLHIHNSDMNIYLDNTDSELETLKLIRDLISKSKNFCHVSLTSHILHFKHSKIEAACELTIKNEIPVGNSELIKFYLTLDDKIRELILIVKFWADCYGLRKGESFSSYAIYILVIFYLQQEPYKLPSVNDLQKDLPSDEIDGWNCAFGPVEFVNTALQQATLLEVLSGFFKFYGKFDYMSYVISPYFGSSLEKIRFLKRDLPECFEDYMNQEQEFVVNSGICIQDPFEHATNVSVSVSLAHAGKFSSVCRKSFRLLTEDSKNVLYDLFMTIDESVEFSIERSEVDEAMKNITSKVLTEVFSCKVEEIDSKGSDICFVCEGRYNIWDNRFKNLPSDLPNDLSKETAVTSLIVANSCQDFFWRMRVELKFDRNTSVVTFLLIDEEHLAVVSHLGHFLYICLEKFLDKTTPLAAVKTENQSLVQSCKQEKMFPEENMLDDVILVGSEVKNEVFPEESMLEDDVILVSSEVKNEVVCLDDDSDDEVIFVDSQDDVKIEDNLSVNGPSSEQTVHLISETSVKNEDTVDEVKIENNSAVHVKTEKTQDNSHIIRKDIDIETEDNLSVDGANKSLQKQKINELNVQPSESKRFSTQGESQGPHTKKVLPQLVTISKRMQNFNLQLKLLQKELEIKTAKVAAKFRIVQNDIRFALISAFYEAEITLFGSVFTGLATKYHTWDIHIDVPYTRETLELAEKLLKESSKFSDVFIIPERETIIFHHTATKLQCELHLRNKLPVHTTNLIKSYMSLDRRLCTTVYTIKYWADCYSFDFSNYVVALLLIFYLEQLSKLPSVMELQKNLTPHIVCGWNCNYNSPKPTQLPLEKEILIGFFKFYADFDYYTYVVSPFMGSCIEKWRFLRPYDLPETFQNYAAKNEVLTMNSGLCIQDPLEHSKNLTAKMSLSCSERFSSMCRSALQLLVSSQQQTLTDLLKDCVQNQCTVIIEKSGTQESEKWKLKVEDTLLKILRDVLCGVFTKIGDVTYECCGKVDIWNDRINVLKSVFKCDANELQNEIAATKCIVDKSLHECCWNLVVDLSFSDMGVEIKVEGDYFVHHLSRFLQTKFAKFMESMESRKKVVPDMKECTRIETMEVEEGVSGQKLQQNEIVEENNSQSGQNSEVGTVEVALNRETEDGSIEKEKSYASKIIENIELSLQREYYDIIIEDLNLALSSTWPNTKFVILDLEVLGVGFIKSEIFIDFGPDTEVGTQQFIRTIGGKFSYVSLTSLPVIECQHVATKRACYLNITSTSVSYVSDLISYYFKLDEKLRTMMLIIKSWLYLSYRDPFPNLMLYLMVIFYLQHKPYNLPSVLALQKNATPKTINGWNYSFQSAQFSSEVLKNVTIEDLLENFFKFYSNFDYVSYIIVPYYGSKIRKTCFLQSYDLPEDYHHYINQNEVMSVHTGICVQDPFVHSKNISVSLRTSGIFATLCRSAYYKIKNLENILLDTNKWSTTFHIVKDTRGDQRKWVVNIAAIILKIMKEILSYQVEIANVHGFGLDFTCHGRNDIWSDRVNMSKEVWRQNLSDLENEIAVTRHMVRDETLRQPWRTRIRVNFESDTCYVVFKTRKTRSLISHLSHFLYTKLLTYLDAEYVFEQIEAERLKIEAIKFEEDVTGSNDGGKSGTDSSKNNEGSKNKTHPAEKSLERNGYATRIIEDIQLSLERENYAIIVEDLKFALLPTWPNTKFVILDLEVLGVGFSKSEIFIDFGPDTEVGTQEVMNAICGKFSYVSPTTSFIKCQHVATKRRCYLNITSTPVSYVSDLISYYFKSDEKLRTMMLIIKSCINTAPRDPFPSLMLYLMVIFYLQHKPYNLPSVLALQKDATPKIINGWNYSFRSTHFSSEVLKNVTVEDLLEGFFKFYLTFDYFSYIIAPYYGSKIRKTCFLQPYNLPEEYHHYINKNEVMSFHTGLCLQDPFIHSKNISVSLRSSGVFAMLCKSAYYKIKNLQNILVNAYIGNPDFQISNDSGGDQRKWNMNIAAIILKIVREIFGCKVNIVVDHDLALDFTYYSQNDIWSNRIKMSKDLWQQNLNDLENEVAVTRHMIRDETLRTPCRASMKVSFKSDTCYVVFEEPEKSSLLFHLSHFLYTKLLTYLDTDYIFGQIEAEKLEIERVTGGNEGGKSRTDSSKDSEGGKSETDPAKKAPKNVARRNINVHVLNEIKKRFTFEDQIFQLQTATLIDKDLNTIYKKLHSLLNVNITFYGSTEMSLELPCSDLNIYIDFEENPSELKKILSKCNMFRDITSTWTGIECIYIPTETLCRINIADKSLLSTSNIIQCYLAKDKKIHALTALVKFWAFYHKMDVENLSSYALYLMVIFYLQVIYNLPPLEVYQKDVCHTFSSDVTVWKLVIGFFKFYGDFDHISFVISPLCGSSIEKLRFEMFPLHSGLCIQDPFNISRNVTENVSLQSAGRFAALCRAAFKSKSTKRGPVIDLLQGGGSSIYEFDIKWTSEVEKTVSTIFDIFGWEVVRTYRDCDNALIYSCKDKTDVWKGRVDLLKKLWRNDLDELNNEVEVTQYIVSRSSSFTDHMWQVKFMASDKCRVIYGMDTTFHHIHFLYTRLRKMFGKDFVDLSPVEPNSTSSGSELRVGRRHNCDIKYEFKGTRSLTFSQQVSVLRGIQKSHKIESSHPLFKDLDKILSPTCPKSEITFYGSRYMGLELPNSDLNIYVDINQDPESLIQTILRSRKFRDVEVKSKIIVCVHIFTRLQVCFNLKEVSHMRSASLLDYYFSLNNKVQSLMLLVKFWYANYNTYGDTFSSYHLYLMVIFYLQQSPYNLPAVTNLQENSDHYFEYTFANISFESATLEQLIEGFFKFYANFDYITYIISPYLGSPIEKVRFLQPYDLPSAFQPYADKNEVLPTSAGICIQDPFIHSINLSQTVSLNCAGKFAALCRAASEIISCTQEGVIMKLFKSCAVQFTYCSLLNVDSPIGQEHKAKVDSLILKVLKDVFKAEVTREESNASVTYKSKTNVDVWTERVNVMKHVRDMSDELSKEIFITLQIMCQNPPKLPHTDLILTYDFETSTCIMEKYINSFHFAHFLYLNLGKFLMLDGDDQSVDMREDYGERVEPSVETLEVEENISSKINENDENEVILNEESGIDNVITDKFLLFYEKIIYEMKQGVTLDAEVTLLKQHIQEARNEKYDSILKDLKVALVSNWSEDKILVVGSRALGLDLPHSDRNFYIEIEEDSEMQLLKDLLYKSEKFSDVLLTETVVWCKHISTEAECIINTRDKFLVLSTSLINYYLNLDEKISDLFLLIKLWLYCYKNDFHEDFLSGCSLYLMIIFYLQQKYALPAAMEVIYCPIMTEATSEGLKKATLQEMLLGFFKYYGDFDYITFVISSYLGSPIEKICFLRPRDLPDAFHDYINQDKILPVSSGICIQNPYTHYTNLSDLKSLNCGGKFAALCRSSYKILDNTSKEILYTLFRTPNTTSQTFDLKNVNVEEVEVVMLKILEGILAGEVTRIEDVTYIASGEIDVFENRINPLKSLFSHGANDLDYEVAVTKRILEEKQTQSKWNLTITIHPQTNPSMTTVEVTGGPNVFHILHFIYMKLMKHFTHVEACDEESEKCEDTEIALEDQDIEITKEIKKYKSACTKLVCGKLRTSHGSFFTQLNYTFSRLNDYINTSQQEHTNIYEDLCSTLKCIYLNVNFFGSRTTRLGFEGSDVNIYVSLKSQYMTSPLETLHLIRNTIAQSSKFMDVTVKKTVVRCIHATTKLVCNLTIERELFQTSELIRYYLERDEKIYYLAELIKVWFCFRDIHFSSYAIHWLVIFFLQQEPYELPSVRDLQKGTKAVLINGHNYNFAPLEYKSLLLHKTSVMELAKGFFSFYGKFDYFTYVISPFHGTSIDKRDLSQFPKLQTGSWMYLQDPFEYSTNLLSSIGKDVPGKFAALCRGSFEVIDRREKRAVSRVLRHCEIREYSDFPSLVIKKEEETDEEEWKIKVREVIVRILKEIIGCTVTITVTENDRYVYKCTQQKKLKCLRQPSTDINEWDKEVALTSHLIELWVRKSFWDMTVEVTFQQNPLRVFVDITKRNNLLLFHNCHFLYTRLLKFLQLNGKTENSKMAVVETVKKGNNFEEQVTIFRDTLQPYQATRDKVYDVICKDAKSAISHAFKEVNLHIYDVNNTGFNLVRDLNIHVDGVKEVSTYVDMIAYTIFKNTKFTEYSLLRRQDLPTVKSRHVPTQTSCIFSVNLDPMRTKQLLNRYFGLDYRIFDLIMVIEFWACCYKLDDIFNNDALYLMVIFYLQQEPYKLPSMMELEQGGSNVVKNLEETTVFDLVKGFFKFYVYFDFFTYTVAPYVGSVIEKLSLQCDESFLFVQHPFEPKKNVWDGFQENIPRFVFCCRAALQILSRPERNSLHVLMQNCETDSLQSSFYIDVNEVQDREKWKEWVRVLSVRILRDVLNANVEKEEVTNGDYSFKCTGSYNVLLNRLHIEKNLLLSDTDELEKEVLVTTNVVNEFPFPKQWTLVINLVFEKNQFRVKVIGERKNDRMLEHYFCLKLAKFLSTIDAGKLDGSKEMEDTSVNIKQNVLKYIEDVSTFKEQLTTLQAKLQIDKLQIEMIQNDLELLFAPNKIFVSSSLYTRGSTLDVVIDCTEDNEVLKKIERSEIFAGTVLISERSTVKCRHKKTRISCDLNLRDKSLEKMSDLVESYFCIDDKVRSLITVIQFWFYCYHLESFSNSAVIMLVIFFLQQEPYKLPTGADLRKTKSVNLSTLQNTSVLDLLEGFFEFYGDFDYISLMICPYFGSTKKKIENSQEDIIDCGFYIQNVLDLSTNVTASVSLHAAGRFTALCRRSRMVLIKSQELGRLLQCDQSSCNVVYLQKREEDGTEWHKRVKEIMWELLVKVLRCVVHFKHISWNEVIYECKGRRDIWKEILISTKNPATEMKLHSSEYNKEVRQKIKDVKNECVWNFYFKLISESNSCSVIVMSNTKDSSLVLHTCHFLHTRLATFLSKHKATNQNKKTEDVSDVIDITDAEQTDKQAIEGSSAEPKKDDQPPIEGSSAEPKKDNQPPIGSSSAEPKKDDQPPIEGSPAEPKKDDQPPIDGSSVEPKKDDQPPIESSPAEPKKGDQPPIESSPAEPKKGDQPPIEDSSAEPKKDDQPPGVSLSSANLSQEPNNPKIKSASLLQLIALNKIRQVSTFADQATIIQEELYTPHHMVYSRTVIKNDLSVALSPVFPTHEIFFFGSVVTSLCTQDSKVDIYVANINLAEASYLKPLSDVIANSGLFSHVTIVQGLKLKVPVIRCRNKKSDVCCELNIKDKLAVKTTELINSYLNLDEKLRKFIFVLKFWVDCYKMSDLFNTYILNLMAIFYLEQKPRLLNPVVKLQKNVSDFVRGWNCGFSPPEVTNTLRDITFLDLVKGFFKFYGDFDYFSNVISPFFGSTISRSRFLQPYNLPYAYKNYVKMRQLLDVNSAICIQDPFEHSNNVAASIRLGDVSKFAALSRQFFQIMQQGVHKLVILPLNSTNFYKFYIEKSEGLDHHKWTETAKEIVLKVMLQVVCCKIERHIVRKDSSVYHYDGHSLYLYNRTGILKSLMPQFTSETSELEKEICLSEKITLERSEVIAKSKTSEFTLEVQFGYSPYRLTVCLNGGSVAVDITHFLYTKLTKFLTLEEIEKYEKNQNTNRSSGEAEIRQTTNQPNVRTVISEEGFDRISGVSAEEAKQLTLKALKNKTTFNQQVAFLKNLLREPISKCSTIQKELERLLTPFTYKKIHFFGSAITKLHTEHSSVDVHVEDLEIQNKDRQTVMIKLKNIISNSNKFSEVKIASGNDGAIVVNCTLSETNWIYKISSSSKHSVYSTRLIEYYLSLDPKVHDLMFIVKYWAEYHDLRTISFFSNYAIYLMVIFYLQQEPYKLPSVEDLQKNCSELIDDWNVAFAQVEFDNHALKHTTVHKLIKGFFKFYADFDYHSFVISPYFGSSLAKIRFVAPYDLPDCFRKLGVKNEGLSVTSGFCIQDPFIHNKNVTIRVKLMSSGKFAALCRAAVQYTVREKDFLCRILEHFHNPSMVNLYTFEIEKKDEVAEKAWIYYVKMVIHTLLTNVMCCKILNVEERSIPQCIAPSVHYAKYSCEGERNFWDARTYVTKNVLPTLPPGVKDIDKEAAISKWFMNVPQWECLYNFVVEVTFTRNPWMASVNVMIKEDPCFHIVHFFYIRTLNALKDYAKVTTSDPLGSVVCEPYKIVVKGLINQEQVNEVNKYFEQFGKITNRKFTLGEKKSSLEYVYREAKVYCHVIQQEHVLNNQKLKLVPLAHLSGKIPNANFKDFRLGVIFSVAESPTFEKQIETLQNKLQIDKHEVETKRTSITEDLKSVLISKFSDLKIYFFGLDFKGCAVSIFVDNVRSDATPEMETLETVKTLIINSGKFSDVSVSFPYIKCEHGKTKTLFDLNIRNKLPVKTSDLVKYYLSLDEKLPVLVILIKFWADCYDLIGRESFSFYSLCMLIIFYLQQEPYSLPAVSELQKGTSPDIVNGWNCAYAEPVNFESPHLQRATLIELVKGFFEFYAKFDYISYVISPFFGRSVEKIRFLTPYDLPEDYKEYVAQNEEIVLNSGMCIQDLFQHTKNISYSLSLDFAGGFASLCRCGFQIMQMEEKFLLYRLFSQCQNESVVDFPGFIIHKDGTISDSDWIRLVKNRITHILTGILKCKLSQSVYEEATHSVSYVCVGQYDVWENRINVMKKCKSELNEIRKEIICTTRLVSDQTRDASWNVVVDLKFMQNPCRVRVIFKKTSGKVSVFHLAHFSYTRLVKFLSAFDLEGTVAESSILETRDKAVSPKTGFLRKSNDTTDSHCDITRADSCKRKAGEKRKRQSSVSTEEGEVTDDSAKVDLFDEISDDDFNNEVDVYDDFSDEVDTDDDFSDEIDINNDFEGLDVVDAWDGDPKLAKEETKKGRSRSKSRKRCRSRSISRKRYRSRSRDGNKNKKKLIKQRRSISRSSSRDSKSPKFKRWKKNANYRSRSRSGCRRRSRSKPYSRFRSRKRSYSKSRSRSSSPLRQAKRKSFLEEIEEKLNSATSDLQSQNNSVHPSVPFFPSLPHSNPVPNFFIGTNFNSGFLPQLVSSYIPLPPLDPPPPPPLPPLPLPPPPPPPPPETSIIKKQTGEKYDFVKLLAEKKISASDFVGLTAKREVSSKSTAPPRIPKKVKVFARCQKVIKLLSENRQGRLKVKPSTRLPAKPELNFSFTTPFEESQECDAYGRALNQILQNVGLLKLFMEDDADDLVDAVIRGVIRSDSVDRNSVTNILSETLLETKSSVVRKIDVGTQCAGTEDARVDVQMKSGNCDINEAALP